MADPGFRGSAAASNINVASLVLDWSGVGASAGDFGILVIAGTSTVDLPSGWSAVTGTPTTVDGRTGRLTAFTKTLTSGDVSGAATFTLTAGVDTGADWSAIIYVSGPASLDVAATKDETQLAVAGTAVQAPSISPASTNTRCVFFHGTIGETGGQSPTWTADGATTKRRETSGVSGSLRNPTLLCADQLVAATGATGTRTATASATVRRAGLTFALTAAGGGGSNVTGTAAAAFTFDAPAAGKRTVKGSTAAAFTLNGTAVGRRTVKGSTAAQFAFNAPVAGTRKVLGSATAGFTFNAPASGGVEGIVEGSAAAAFTFNAPAVGRRTVRGAALASFTFNAPASGGEVGTVARAAMAAAVHARRTSSSSAGSEHVADSAVTARRTEAAAVAATRTQTSGVS